MLETTAWFLNLHPESVHITIKRQTLYSFLHGNMILAQCQETWPHMLSSNPIPFLLPFTRNICSGLGKPSKLVQKEATEEFKLVVSLFSHCFPKTLMCASITLGILIK